MCVFIDYYYIGLIFWFNGSDCSGIFYFGKFCYLFLFFNYFVIIDDDIFSKMKYWIVSIFQFKYVILGQVLYGSNKKCCYIEYQIQVVEGILVCFFIFFFLFDCYYVECKNK